MFYPTPCRCGGLKDKRAALCLTCRKAASCDTTPERFWEHVIKHDGCWGWHGTKHLFGYGKIRITKPRSNMDAHRYSWILHFGSVPEGMQVLHKCDTPECTNPAHLFIGTQADNMADMRAKGREATGSKHGSRTQPDKFPGRPENFIGYRGRTVARHS